MDSTFTRTTRSLVVLIVGAALTRSTWAWGVPQPPGQNWTQWVIVNAASGLLVPLAVVMLFFTEPLGDYGLRWGDWRKGCRWGFTLFFVALPVLMLFSRLPQAQRYYRSVYLPPTQGAPDFLLLTVTTLVYMFCWEYFFRGFLLFGLGKGLGALAILLQAILFALAHANKPPLEVAGSFIAGVVLGAASWECKSFLPAFIAHGLGHATFNLLVLLPP